MTSELLKYMFVTFVIALIHCHILIFFLFLPSFVSMLVSRFLGRIKVYEKKEKQEIHLSNIENQLFLFSSA